VPIRDVHFVGSFSRNPKLFSFETSSFILKYVIYVITLIRAHSLMLHNQLPQSDIAIRRIISFIWRIFNIKWMALMNINFHFYNRT
jgi:hypothetical protein